MKAFKMAVFTLILLFVGNISKTYAVNTINTATKKEVLKEAKTINFIGKVKKAFINAKKQIDKNLKNTIILWLGGAILVLIGGVLSIFVIGIPILILGVIVMFSGTFFFYKWLISMKN